MDSVIFPFAVLRISAALLIIFFVFAAFWAGTQRNFATRSIDVVSEGLATTRALSGSHSNEGMW